MHGHATGIHQFVATCEDEELAPGEPGRRARDAANVTLGGGQVASGEDVLQVLDAVANECANELDDGPDDDSEVGRGRFLVAG